MEIIIRAEENGANYISFCSRYFHPSNFPLDASVVGAINDADKHAAIVDYF